MPCLIFEKVYNCLSLFKNLFDILPSQISGRISGIKPNIRPDIRYPALTVYLAGYPVSGFWISRIPASGRPDIRQKQYPVHP
jgi:hypothetical protein